jgi:NADH-quinone oxidoreductase subunit E
MRAKIGALMAAVAAAASAAGATVWARRRKGAAGGGQAGNEPTRAPAKAPAAQAQAQPAAEAPTPEPEAIPAETGAVDELTAIKGLGSVSEGRLREIGVTTLGQIAGWSDEDIDEVGARIHISPERIRREDWVGQARAKLED